MGKANERLGSRWKHLVNSVSIIGPNGQLGTDLVKVFSLAGWKVVPITHTEISVENFESVTKSLKSAKTNWVINTAAFHKVDECEKDSQRAWEINTTGAKNVSVAAKELGMRSVFISSDYVFSGNKGSAYTENDQVSPINAYGYSKAGGESATLAVSEDNLVVRIASVFGEAGSSGKGGNFVETIIKKAKAGEPFNVVDDILMSPTHTVDASVKILELLTNDCSGIYNASNAGMTSWFSFASEILAKTKLDTSIIPSETNFESIPKRPKNSSLDISKVEKILSKSPTWSEGLNCYLLKKGHIA
jgi:dTDP-4-dehydrorhamnose reductase